ncbi:hypothetical protein K3152_12110 [Qipengyuania sp. 1NDH17]|uniref:Tetratricopeptide repeat protein n=1 Tax=Qipengyuania polymorpha TaxID=2867234 RepID=A0ABS7J4K0_9SPHN|nr:hypothetical protein [Qipengyuania polymorpha]MBX7458994.1 hypothetical protein [Qipengyuania polymorpha]
MKPATTLALVALATSLGGCKSFVQAFDFSKHSNTPQYAIGPADLEEGRAQLKAGNPGNAIAPLHRAALDPALRGEALNALGVAYAKLGRADLAERYFVSATRINPERFAANLDRFYRSDLAQSARFAFHQRQQAAEQYAEFARSEEALAEDAAPDRRVVMSGGEKRTITLSQATPSRRVSVGKLAPVEADAPAPAKPRVQLSSGQPLTAPQITARPAEIRLQSRTPEPAARVRVGEAGNALSYPLRVRLAPRKAPSSKD